MKISYGKNVYGKEEIAAVNKTLLKSTQMGKSVKEFEKKIAKYFSKKYGLMVNSGSSALTLAMNVLNIKKGDEIITPCLNFGTAVSAIVLAQAIPIFIDVEVETLQIDVSKIEEKITNKTKAILVPNLIGNLPNWEKIYKLSKRYNLKIIEDSADTLGATINNKSTGIFSDISITSFYGSHVISCAGNGGMFLTNNNEYFNRAKVLRSWGRMSTLLSDSENIKKRLDIKLKGIEFDKKFVFSEVGYNFEPSEIGASFGLIQLKKFSKFSKKRNLNFNIHKNFFSKYTNYFITPKVDKNVKTNFLAYPVIIRKNKKFNRKKMQIFLEKNKIQTRPIFTGNILRHPAFKNLTSPRNKLKNFVNSDYIMKHGLLIGCHQGLNEKNLNFIHQKILKLIK
jgi:CDP-6-deoxy-D-xylo-4-hexulose-3-dehydrase|tara:strand:- start:73 stop:1257 length:1185 start_codon:yes stop_codon:yes gene_type:complete